MNWKSVGIIAASILGLLLMFTFFNPYGFNGPQSRPYDNYNNNSGVPWGGPENMGPGIMNEYRQNNYSANRKANYSSNGEKIYFTATNEKGETIQARMMGMNMTQMLYSCVDCHGENGQGMNIRMHMGSYQTPNITYTNLTTDTHAEGEEDAHGDHPLYTDETIIRAIRQGLDPADEPLEYPMPRWDMTQEDASDLVEHLKLFK